MTPCNPFTPIPLPEVLTRYGIESLLFALFGGRENYADLHRQYSSREGLLTLMPRLNEREITALILRYGLDGSGEKIQAVVGEALNITGSRAANVLGVALSKMRGSAISAKRGRSTLSSLLLKTGDVITFDADGKLIIVHTDTSVSSIDEYRVRASEISRKLDFGHHNGFQQLCSVVAATHGLGVAKANSITGVLSCKLVAAEV